MTEVRGVYLGEWMVGKVGEHAWSCASFVTCTSSGVLWEIQLMEHNNIMLGTYDGSVKY